MRTRFYLSIALGVVVIGCTATADNPTAASLPDVGTAHFAGVKPPPPLGTEETFIEIDFFGGGEFAGLRAADAQNFQWSNRVFGRYFANNPLTNGWIDFASGDGVIASPNARLEYNNKNGKTKGHGTLTDSYGVVLDLSKIQITSGGFGKCTPVCANIAFTYDGLSGGFLFVTTGPGPG